MKKNILCIVLFLAFAMSISVCFADDLVLTKESEYQKRIMEVGYKILNANEIDKRITFYYVPNKYPGTISSATAKQVQVYKGILPFIDNEDELAGILSHEIAHCLDYYEGIWSRYYMNNIPNYFEYKADAKAIDLMIKAGYNPLAYLGLVNKIAEEPSWFERSAYYNISGDFRLKALYEYLYSKYPSYLANNECKNSLYYQNFLLISQQFRQKTKDKYLKLDNIPANDTTNIGKNKNENK